MTLISEETFEKALNEARAGVRHPNAGLFGPASLMWQVGREAVLFLGAGRAALLQTAHPFVAAAIDQHSDVRNDPLARFRRTFANVFDMVFGSQDDAMAAALKVRSVHNFINGELQTAHGRFAAGTPYSAHDEAAVRWVHATLWDSALRIHDMFLPTFDAEGCDLYWQEARRFAALFGLTSDMMPQTFEAFAAYMDETLTSDMLAVGPEARDIADHLLKGKGAARALPKWYVALTAGLLPPHLRDAYGLTFGPLDRRRAERAIARLRFLHPKLPAKLRYVPPFHRAEARLKGKPAPDLVTRGLEKIWLGGKQ